MMAEIFSNAYALINRIIPKRSRDLLGELTVIK